MITAIIIDDLDQSRINLKADLQDYCPDVKVIGEADSVVSSLKLLKKEKPGIVFLDIHLTDGSGFDLLELLDDVSFKVIFTTASDAFAIKAFKFSAIDYLLKPIDPDDLIKAVKHAADQFHLENKQVDLLLENVKDSKEQTKIALHTSDKIHICKIQDIVRCESNGNYTSFFFIDGSKLLVSKTLKSYDQMFTDLRFLRVHQSHLINLNHIKEYVKHDGGYIVMNDQSIVPISSRKKMEVIQIISEIN